MISNNSNIIILSDLNWLPHLRSLSMDEVMNFKEEDLSKNRYERIQRYHQTILDENANLVLFAGDVTGDGFCGRGYHLAFFILLSLLEKKSIPTFFISGNHDPDGYYLPLLKMIEEYKFVQEISGKIVSINGMKIQGLNYDTSKSKRALKKVLLGQIEEVDIVLAHSQIKRRIMHFDLPCKYIFTGHYDRKLLTHRQKVFVALDNDSEDYSYALLRKQEEGTEEVSIKIVHSPKHIFSLKEKVSELLNGKRNAVLYINDVASYDFLKFENASDDSLSRDGDHFLYLKYLRGINYSSSLDTMYKMAQGIPLDLSDLSLNQIHGLPITASYRISESMIEDYLGNVID